MGTGVLTGLREAKAGRLQSLEILSSTMIPIFGLILQYSTGLIDGLGDEGRIVAEAGRLGVPTGDLRRLLAKASNSSHSPLLSDNGRVGRIALLEFTVAVSGVPGIKAGRDLCLATLRGLSLFIEDILFGVLSHILLGRPLLTGNAG